MDLSANAFTVNGSVFHWGDLVNTVINFVIVATAIYLIVVIPMQRIQQRRAKPALDVTTRECPECLSNIPKAARRCAFCTAEVGAAA